MDGSSKEFVETILKIGVREQKAKRKYLKILKKFEFKEDEKIISIEPNDNSLKVDFELVYSNEVIGKQRNEINFSDKDLSNVYTSRTFCLFEDVEKIKKIGLAKGGSLDNAIVVKDNKILNTTGLRNTQGGHSLSNLFLRELLDDHSNYSMIELEESKITKSYFKTPENKLAVNA